ncbi:MAG TPA: SDR family NAD(P)-dependent oxidoreductase [Acidimicrobiales bacterium]|jgi:NAD(P)-dependent dehydrogenase (short-subunit alcohol dehydrogenase family)|nr:SDR family NAD(P)-dependent oxidoreductase [Acidimicrobiales bacterium]
MAQPINYEGRTAVVTGAASGIGRALSIALAQRGANLAISDVNETGLAETVERCAGAGGKIESYRLDVADRAAMVAHADEVATTFGAVHLVINNAGVAVAGTIEETTFDDFDWLLGINLNGVINGSKAFLPHLIESGDGHLVNLSSVFGLIAPAFNGAYCTAKFGVRGFTEALRQEMRIQGHPVTVHSVHPGGIRTNIARSARIKDSALTGTDGRDPGEEFDRIARTTPAKAAKTILGGVDADKARILVGPDAYVIAALPRVIGGRYVDLFGRVGRAAWRRRQAQA